MRNYRFVCIIACLEGHCSTETYLCISCIIGDVIKWCYRILNVTRYPFWQVHCWSRNRVYISEMFNSIESRRKLLKTAGTISGVCCEEAIIKEAHLYHCTKNLIYTKFTQCKYGTKKCKLRLNQGQRW